MKSGHSLDGLMKWLERDEWAGAFEDIFAQHIAPACEQVDVDVEEVEDLIGSDWPAILWGCAFEDLLTQRFPDGSNIVDDYLKRRGWNESVANKAYMAGLRESVMSVYEVSNIEPGRSMDVRDLLRGGEPVRISEKSATRTLKQWDRIAARVVRLKTKAILAGGLLPYSYEMAETIRSFVDRARAAVGTEIASPEEQADSQADLDADSAAANDNPIADDDILRAACPFFTSVWLTEVLEKALGPSLPELLNSDGDEVIFTKVHYRLGSGVEAAAIRSALANISQLHQESDVFWNWVETREPRPQKSRGDMAGRAMRWEVETDQGGIVLGNVELVERALILSANSPERAERGRALLEPALADLVLEPLVETQSVEQMMAETTEREAPPVDLPPEVEMMAVHQTLDRHYAKTLDEPIPALDNMTPRDAARTDDGRARVVDWLKHMENASAKAEGPLAVYDFTWVWEELGLAQFRQ